MDSRWTVPCSLWLLLFGSALPTGAATDHNLYQWMGVAPVVVVGKVLVDDAKYIEMEIVESLRGDLEVGDLVQVNQKRANRDRELGERPLRMEAGKGYLVLLRHAKKRGSEDRAHLEVVRGVRGSRAVPAEGAPAFLEAARRLAEVQNFKDDRREWLAFEEMLDDTNPLLLNSALEMFLEFRRGEPAQFASLLPLLDHPRPDVRSAAARLIGQIFERAGGQSVFEEGIVSGLIGRARRDPSVEVRVAATQSLGAVPDTGAETALKQIAGGDPDQAVRYAAERMLYERRERERSSGDSGRQESVPGEPNETEERRFD